MDKVARGNRAKEMLKDDIFNEAFDHIRENLLGMFENSDAQDSKGRERAWLQMNALKEVHRYFQIIADEGTMESAINEEKEKRSKLNLAVSNF